MKYLFALILTTLPCLLFANNLYKNQYNEAKTKYEEAKGKQSIAKASKKAALVMYESNLDNMIEHLNNLIFTKYNGIEKEKKEELRKLKKEVEEIKVINDNYQVVLKRLLEKYKVFIQSFKTYYDSSEQVIKNYNIVMNDAKKQDDTKKLYEYVEWLLKVEAEEDTKYKVFIVKANRMRDEIILNYNNYAKSIANYKNFTDKYKFKIIPYPTATVQKIKNIINYSLRRKETLVMTLRDSIKGVYTRIDSLIAAKRLKSSKEIKAKVVRSEQAISFLKKVGEITSELKRVQFLKNDKGIKIITPLYEVHKKIDQIRKACGDMKQLKARDSYLYTGCALMQDYYSSSDKFFKSGLSIILRLAQYQIKSKIKDVNPEKIHNLGELIKRNDLYNAMILSDYLANGGK